MSVSKADFMLEPEAVGIFNEYGIPYPVHRFVRSADEAVHAAEEIDFPVVLKIVSPRIIHKSDAGGVVTGLEKAEDVRIAFEHMTARILSEINDNDIRGALVCRQAEPGLEVIVGSLQDPVFGPTLMFGMGGIFTEILNDVSFRIVPVEYIDVEEMITEIKGYPILAGARGEKPRDIKALADILLAVGRLVSERPEVGELDLNPVRLYEKGAMVLDARISIVT
jgi:acyl-CoA synthetase (NDP forming)